MTTKKDHDRADAKASILAILGDSRTVYTKVDSVSRSGMTRVISCYVVTDGEVRDISHLVARAVGWTQGKRGGVKVTGCGMDMGFHLIYTLSYGLFPRTEEGKDGGYTLRQRWL